MNSRNKFIFSGLLAFSATSIAYAETSIEAAISQGKVSGQARLGYITHDPDVSGANTTTAAAIGGFIKYETAEWNRLKLAIAPYFSEKIGPLSGDEDQSKLNGDFFDSNNDSYAYLGEAYIQYSWSQGSLAWGRQQLDNPFVNTDDIRISPNTFDAVWVNYSPIEDLSIEGGFIQHWAGVDSGGSQDKFKDASNDGVQAIGANYKIIENFAVQAWLYNFDKSFDLLYADAVFGLNDFEISAQIASFSEDSASNIDGSVLGVSLSYTLDKFVFSAAINEASNDTGKSVDNGLGGGNFFTSMDETTIAGMNDASAYTLGIEYAFNERFTLAGVYGHFEDGTKASSDIDELNAILTYSFNDKMDAELVHTIVDNDASPTDASTNFSRQLLRVNYNF